jgi:hypothetical protein
LIPDSAVWRVASCSYSTLSSLSFPPPPELAKKASYRESRLSLYLILEI